MDFTKFDISILFTMSLAVVVMSFAFPALGMTDQSDEVNESDIPEFNLSASTFDFAGEFPEEPNTPSSGMLEYDQTMTESNSIAGISLEWIERPKDTGASVEVQNTSQNGFDVVFTDYNSTGDAFTYRYDIKNETGQTILAKERGWVIEFTVSDIENYNESNMTAEVGWNIKSNPDNQDFISSLPIIGGISDAVGNAVGFIGVLIGWVSLTIIEIVVNAVSIILSVVVYLFGMAAWLADTYGSVVSAAPSWSGVILSVPGVLVFAEFAKLGAIAVKMLPTT